MYSRLKQLLLSNAVMVVCSLILGYSLWYMLSSNRIIQQTILVPVTIYNQTGAVLKQTQVTARVQGAHHAIAQLMNQPPTITLAQQTPEQHTVLIKNSDIILPQTIALLQYVPHEITL